MSNSEWELALEPGDWNGPVSPITEEFDSTWPYNFKWGIDGRTGNPHVWRCAGMDGPPAHRPEMASFLGREMQVRQGDIIGLAQYIPAEQKLDGTLVAPPTVQIQTYYGMETPPTIVQWFEETFPGADVRNAAIVQPGLKSLRQRRGSEDWHVKKNEPEEAPTDEFDKPEKDIDDPELRSYFPTDPKYLEHTHRDAAVWAQERFSRPPSEEDEGFIEHWVASLRRALIRSGSDGADHEGAMVALYVPPEVGKQIRIRGGEPLKDLHVTLIYFADKAADRDDWDEARKIVKQFSQQYSSLEGVIGGYGVFNSDDGDVLWASVDMPGINELHYELVESLENTGFPVSKEHSFTPHITLQYDHKGKLPKLDKSLDVQFDQLTLMTGDKRHDYDFTGEGFLKIISS